MQGDALGLFLVPRALVSGDLCPKSSQGGWLQRINSLCLTAVLPKQALGPLFSAVIKSYWKRSILCPAMQDILRQLGPALSTE